MPINNTIKVTRSTYVELTIADVTSITLQNKHPLSSVYLQAGAAGAPPIDDTGAVILPPLAMFLNENLADLWPGATGAVRVYARAENKPMEVLVSHA